MSVHRLDQHQSGEPAYLDAAAKAVELGVSRDFVYRHANELGAIRIGRIIRFPRGVSTAPATHKEQPSIAPLPTRSLKAVANSTRPAGSVLSSRPAQGRARRAAAEAEVA